MVVMNHCYDVLRMNKAMERFMQLFIKDPTALSSPINTYRILFDPLLARDAVGEGVDGNRHAGTDDRLEELRGFLPPRAGSREERREVEEGEVGRRAFERSRLEDSRLSPRGFRSRRLASSLVIFRGD